VARQRRTNHNSLYRPYLALNLQVREGSVSVSNLENLLSIDHRAGDVTVDSIGDRTQIRSQGGKVQVTNIAKDLKLDTKESELTIKNIKQRLAIRHKDGDIHVQNVNGTLIMNTMKGDVELSDMRERLDIDHRDGDIVANHFTGGVRIYLYDGDVRLAPQVPIPNNYYCVVDNGNVIVRVPPESSMLAEIEVESGSIHSDFHMPIWADKAISFSKGAINGGENIIQLSVKNGSASLMKGLGSFRLDSPDSTGTTATQISSQPPTQQELPVQQETDQTDQTTGQANDELQAVEIPE